MDLDEASFPRDAVYAAAYTFIDRCWVRLDKGEAGRLAVVLREKSSGTIDGEAVAAELRSELFGQTFRVRLAEEGRALTDSVIRAAYGGSDSPAVDDLLAAGAPFEDPLGIALQWEAQQAAPPAPPEPVPDAEAKGDEGA
jgi:His-Xaa-Ser system protein HxsD